VVGYSKSLVARFMAVIGPPGEVEVRALIGTVNLCLVDSKSSYRGECQRMSTRMRTRKESRKVAGRLLVDDGMDINPGKFEINLMNLILYMA